jgi:hypothetical protein
MVRYRTMDGAGFARQIYRYTVCFYKGYSSETMLAGESRFHISTPLGIEPESLMTGGPLDQWNCV